MMLGKFARKIRERKRRVIEFNKEWIRERKRCALDDRDYGRVQRAMKQRRATIVIQVKDEPEEEEVYSRIREMCDWVQEHRVRRRTWQESKVLAVPSSAPAAPTGIADASTETEPHWYCGLDRVWHYR